MKRKVCIVTGTRAEYGLLSGLMKEVAAEPDLQLQIIATGTHLSPEFGNTYKYIETDGFTIDKKVDIQLSSDSPAGISKSMGLAHMGLSEAYAELQPDIIVLLGDRFEILCAAAAACVAGIPVAHLHGGEKTEGAMDEAFRHAVTKMSHLHFTSTDDYRQRVIQLGEQPDRVFNVGAPGVENIRKTQLLGREALEKEIGFSLGGRCFLVTFHPATLEAVGAREQFQEVLEAVDSFKDANIIFTYANADSGGRIVNGMIESYVEQNAGRSARFASMGQLRYLSALAQADVLVGNSSSGIVEAPALKTPTVNIGDRQKGRIRAAGVIDCEARRASVAAAIEKALSGDFRQQLELMDHPYEKPGTARAIKEAIKRFDLSSIVMKKFYDLDSFSLNQEPGR